MADQRFKLIKDFYGLTGLDDASNDLANANALRGITTDATDAKGEPFKFGEAATNAIAHTMSSAYLAHDRSPLEAYLLGFGHEWIENTAKNKAWDTYKDLYNNQVGRNIAAYVKQNKLARNQIQPLVLDALTTGKLIVTRNDPRIDENFNGNAFNFKLPTSGAPLWAGPSPGYGDYFSTVRQVPMSGPTGKRSTTGSRTDTAFGNIPPRGIRYVSGIRDQAN